jgi:hypothetical protein
MLWKFLSAVLGYHTGHLWQDIQYVACTNRAASVKVIETADILKMVMEENSDLMGQDAMFLGYRRFDRPQCLCLQDPKSPPPFLDFNVLLGPLS